MIGFYSPGELMGLEGLGNGRFRSDAVALELAQVCEVPLPALERVAAQRPEFQRQMMRALGEGMARHQGHLEVLGRDPLHLHLPMSRFDIGSYLSLVIETVSRGLSKLQDDGVISVKGRHLGVLEPAVPARLAHGE